MSVRAICGRFDGENCVETFYNPEPAVKFAAKLQEAGCSDAIISAEGSFFVVNFTVSAKMIENNTRHLRIGNLKKILATM
jgi:hypothetical protein